VTSQEPRHLWEGLPDEAGKEIGPEGEPVGRDPRKMRPDELRALGHRPMSPIRALRLRCLDCCGGSAKEVRWCVAADCPAWPFRMGVSPYRAKRTLTEAQRERLALSKKSSLSARAARDGSSEGCPGTPARLPQIDRSEPDASAD